MSTFALIITIARIITADDESRIVVATRPVRMEVNKLPVNFLRMSFVLLPNISLSVLDKLETAYKKSPNPPSIINSTSIKFFEENYWIELYKKQIWY